MDLDPISFCPLAKAPGVSQIQIQLTQNIIYCLPLTVPYTLFLLKSGILCLVAQGRNLKMAELRWLLQDSEMELCMHRSGVCTQSVCVGAVSSSPHPAKKSKSEKPVYSLGHSFMLNLEAASGSFLTQCPWPPSLPTGLAYEVKSVIQL